MGENTNAGLSLTGYDIDELARPLEQAYAIIQCVRDATGNASESPYIEPALNAAADLLFGVKQEMGNLRKQADTEATP